MITVNELLPSFSGQNSLSANRSRRAVHSRTLTLFIGEILTTTSSVAVIALHNPTVRIMEEDPEEYLYHANPESE